MTDRIQFQTINSIPAALAMGIMSVSVAGMVWGLRLEGRVNTEEALRLTVEKRMEVGLSDLKEQLKSAALERGVIDNRMLNAIQRLDDKVTANFITLMEDQKSGHARPNTQQHMLDNP